MADNRPIGVFDSGLGGLSVLRALFHELPNESFIYYADSGNCPYGDKPLKRVQQLSIDITSLLISMECKMVVVACNSATAAAIDELRDRFTIPFVGIEPAVKQAALLTKSGKVGVLATEHTFNGRLFQETSHRYAAGKDLFVQIGAGLVEIVEQGMMHTEATERLISSFVMPMVEAGVDQIVLGCTHYPFLIPVIKKIAPPGLTIHDPSPAVARQAHRLLESHEMNAASLKPDHRFITSGSEMRLRKMLEHLNIMNPTVTKVAPF